MKNQLPHTVPHNSMYNRGFTLLEMLVVIMLFAILGAFTVPYSARSYRNYQITSETKNVVNILRRAQISAMANTNQSRYGISFGSTSYTLFQGSSFASRNATYDEVYPIATAISVSAPAEIVFEQFSGKPATNSTITLTSREKIQSIIIGKEGTISW